MRIVEEPFARATDHEADFVKRLLTGELRQGALAGLMADAVAKAAGVPGEVTRRALMLSGELTRTAEIAMTRGEQGLREVGLQPLLIELVQLALGGVLLHEFVNGLGQLFLARAHRGFLYIDEVNLLEDHLVDLLLDVAASGWNLVEREGLSVRHPARFVQFPFSVVYQ